MKEVAGHAHEPPGARATRTGTGPCTAPLSAKGSTPDLDRAAVDAPLQKSEVPDAIAGASDSRAASQRPMGVADCPLLLLRPTSRSGARFQGTLTVV